MREILFRGKCRDTGRWYEGYYIGLHKTTYCFEGEAERNKENEIHQIVFEQMTDWNLPNKHLRVDVIPETVGQYIGLNDKNGKKIFEGDIVKDEPSQLFGKVVYATAADGYDGMAGFMVDDIYDGLQDYNGFWHLVEVIGNIHDNPELLDGVGNG